MSFPAWSNFLTGLRPGRHGLFDFTLEALTQLRTTNVQPGVWGNLRGREPAGGVAPEDNERVRDEIIAVRHSTGPSLTTAGRSSPGFGGAKKLRGPL